MTFTQLQNSLLKGERQPVYFLHGKEPYFIDAIADTVEGEVLSEAEKAFNLSVFYGKEAEPKTVIDVAMRYPMGAERQVVVLREAQDMKELDGLAAYVAQPVGTTLLLICYKHKKFNFKGDLGKALKKNAVIFESKPLYENKIPAWIEGWLRERGLKAEPDAAALVAEYLGTDLGKVANELNKLVLNLPPGAPVDRAAIETHIGISKDYNIFELQRALGGRRTGRAFRIVEYFAANPRKHPVPMVLATLYGFFSKVYMLHFLKNDSEEKQMKELKLRSRFFLRDYRQALKNYSREGVEQVLGLLREYDLKSKGVGFQATGKRDGDLLRELVFRVLQA